MNRFFILWGVVCVFVVLVNAENLFDYIKPCYRHLKKSRVLSECITEQARNLLQTYAHGIPELQLEPLDPLTLTKVFAKARTFTLASKKITVTGLKDVEIKELKWDLSELDGLTRIFGDLTIEGDYEAEGKVVQLPLNGFGRFTLVMYDTEILIRWSIRIVKDKKGVEHLRTFNYLPSQTYGSGMINLTNFLEEKDMIDDLVNQLLNENWLDLMDDIGAVYIKAIARRVRDILNNFFWSIPYEELFLLPANNDVFKNESE